MQSRGFTPADYRALEQADPPLSVLSQLMRSAEQGVLHAAALNLQRRLLEGEAFDALPQVLPQDLLALPPETQLVFAKLAIDGVPIPTSKPPTSLPATVRLAWLQAWLLDHPEALADWEQSTLGWDAVLGLPPERVVETGLLVRLVENPDPRLRQASVAYARAATERGVLPFPVAQEMLVRLAGDSQPSIALEALQTLKEPWAFGLPLPELRVRPEHVDCYVEWIRVLKSRRDLQRLRRIFLDDEAPKASLAAVIDALAELGEGSEVASIIEKMQRDESLRGTSVLEALVLLKRRGFSAETDHAIALLRLYLEGPALEARAVAEVLSSRSDFVVEHIDTLAGPEIDWQRVVALLEAFGTKKAIDRLAAILERDNERSGWPYALRALGRLGVTALEGIVLRRLNDEPEACLVALRLLGGSETVRVLTEHLERSDSLETWTQDAATLLFRLAPSSDLLERMEDKGLLTEEMLDALPAQSSILESGLIREILSRTAHPRRAAAIRAAGRTGGPLAVDLLAPLLSDADETVRAAALEALRSLGIGLRDKGSLRPAILESSEADPAGALVADTILRRLRDRAEDEEALVHLLGSLQGLAHPQLVPVVRPFLRHQEPEIRKLAAACLVAAGPSAAPWLIPWLSADDTTVSRQVLTALGRFQVRGLATVIAPWLDQPNMNLKKVAAEALAACCDVSALPRLLHWIGRQDNPGFRDSLKRALKTTLGSWYCSVLLDRLTAAADQTAQDCLIDALSGELSSRAVAALVRARGDALPVAGWSTRLVRKAFAEEFLFKAGTVSSFEAELRRQGRERLIPATAEDREGEVAWRAPALRAGRQLRRLLRLNPLTQEPLQELQALLSTAAVEGQVLAGELSAWETYTLLDVYPTLREDARTGALRLLSAARLDPVCELRVTRLLQGLPVDQVPPSLFACATSTLSTELARTLVDSTDRGAREAAHQTLALEDALLPEHWSSDYAQVLFQSLLRRGDVATCLRWAQQERQLPLLVRSLRKTLGAEQTLRHLRDWTSRHPEVLKDLVQEVAGLGAAGEEELERVAKRTTVAAGVRVQALAALRLRLGARVPLQLWRDLQGDEIAALRECAAEGLLQAGTLLDRQEVIKSYVRGRFRDEFSIAVTPSDLPYLAQYAESAETGVRLRAIRLLRKLGDSKSLGLLLRLWSTEDPEPKEKCREALRCLALPRILPLILADLDQGNTALLDVLGAASSLPRLLISRYRAGDAHWQRFLERASSGSVLHAPGLLPRLLPPPDRREQAQDSARLVTRLSDWSEERSLPELLQALEPLLQSKERRRILGHIVEAVASLPVTVRVNVLVRTGGPTDQPIVAALADACLESKAVRARLPSPFSGAVERELRKAIDGEPERARRVLVYLASTAHSDTERASLADLLERSLEHPSPRVRAQAHRLLRTHAERSRYLSASRRLLSDTDPNTVRSALRALAFGRHLESVGAIADLLVHTSPIVRTAARDGLLHLGEDALPLLRKALGRARPDRRSAYAEVLEEIHKGAGPEELPEDDDDS